MSRIGKQPIPLPKDVKVQLGPSAVNVQGPKGKLTIGVPHGVKIEQRDGTLYAVRQSDEYRARHGMIRALVANAVYGVSTGFKREMDIVGVGFRAEVKGKTVVFNLGYSHPIEFAIPEGIQIAVEKNTHVVVSGADKAQVGQVVADIRGLRPPDPYKQKGIRIVGERLTKKAGKAAAGAGAAKAG